MIESQVLSEKAIKKLGLDKRTEPNLADRTPVKVWDNYDEYFEEEFDLRRKNKKWYVKVGDFFKYRIGWRTRDWWYNTKWYFRNLRTFQPILKEWRSFSYHYQVDLFKFGIKQLAEAKEYYGNEEEVGRKKRIAAMQELIKEIDRDYDEELREKLNYNTRERKKITKFSDGSVSFEDVDKEAAEKKAKEFFTALAKERKAHYNKIFSLIIGQDNEDIKAEVDRRIAAMPEEERKSMPENELRHKVYNEVWDGSGIEGWWD